MATNIYYIQKDKALLITSNIEKYKINITLGLYPNIIFEEIFIENLSQYSVKSIGFDEVGDADFNSIKDIFISYKFEIISFHNSIIDLSDIVINTKHLILGDKCKINFAEKNFKNINEITFLSVKTFKGKIFDKFEKVEKLILWYENQKSNIILEHFPNLKEFYIYNGSIVELNLTNNPLIERLQLHRALKMEKVILPLTVHLKIVIVEACNKLDTSNLPVN